MKIFVVGATGRVASKLVEALVAKGHQVTAAARHLENVLLKDSPQVTAVKLDLHASSTLQLVHVVKISYKLMPLVPLRRCKLLS